MESGFTCGEQGGDGEAAAGGVPGDDQVLGRYSGVEQLAVGGEAVVDRGGEWVLGGEAVVEADGAGAGAARQLGRQTRAGARRPDDIATAVQAARSGLAEETIRKIERGAVPTPPLFTVAAITAVLDIPGL